MNTTTARNLVRSWLRANNVPFIKSTIPGCDFSIQGRLGDVEVRITARRDETAPAPHVIDVLASDITHKRLEVAFGAYHVITSAAGFGTPIPVDRGEQPNQNLCYKDEDFLVCVRHTALRRSPNAPNNKFDKYDKVMHKACWTYYNLNNDQCRRLGKSVEDLRTYAMVLLNIFCAQIEDEDKDNQHNEQTLYVWLRQRFAEIFKILSNKERSMMPDADTVCIALLGQSYRGQMKFDSDGNTVPLAEDSFGELTGSSFNSDTSYEDDSEYKKRNNKLDTRTPVTRKRSASDMLRQKLEALPHDDRIYRLGFAFQNPLINNDARREAGKQLKLHMATCVTCVENLKTVRNHVGEDNIVNHMNACAQCDENRYLALALAEVDIDEETSVEGASAEE